MAHIKHPSGRNNGRVNWSSPDVASPLNVDCPKCGARRGSTCLSGWHADPSMPGGGIYTKRTSHAHEDRVAANRDAQAGGPAPERAELRKRVSELAGRKLTGRERIDTRRWAGRAGRTEDELRERIEELERMGDLTW
jgi:hypothetical protein